MTDQVTRLFGSEQPGPTADEVTRQYVETARTIARICAIRMLLLIAVVTGAGIWTFTIYAPTTERLHAAVAFSLVFLLPLSALYYRKG